MSDNGSREEEMGLRRTVRENPEDHGAAIRLGMLYREQGKKRAALREFIRIKRTFPELPTPHFLAGEIYFFKKDLDSAATAYSNFLDRLVFEEEIEEGLKKGYIDAISTTARRSWSMQEHFLSYKALRKILEIDPDNVRALYNLGVYYYNHENNRSKAFRVLNRVTEIAPASRLSDQARFFIDYMRRNPDARLMSDLSFLDEM